MNPSVDPRSGHWRAGRAFALLAAVFLIVFGSVVALLGLEQHRGLAASERLQQQTIPEIIRYQRLARNLEQIRQEGERIFAVGTPDARQQAFFILTLVASHPSVVDHPESAAVAREAERFLGETLRRAGPDEALLKAGYGDWQRHSSRLSRLVDDVALQGVNLTSEDLGHVSQIMQLAHHKLIGVLVVVGVFLLVFLWLLRQYLILPLQRIDRSLCTLSTESPPPVFPPSPMAEIQAVESAIGHLHASLIANEQARHELETLANRDGLTGLINRRHFMLLATAELDRAQRYQRPVVVGMADLDFFKQLNDTHGHAAGDTVLRAFAALLQDSLRNSDLICRYGGEEFALLFPESTPFEAEILAERFRARCADHEIQLPDGSSVRVTLSIGLAKAGEDSIDVSLRHADEALYQAKREGRNRVVLAASPVEQPA